MKFTIAHDEIKMLLDTAGARRPREADTLTLFACAARVFVQTGDGIAGIESLVLADGAVRLSSKAFRCVLNTYKGTKFLTLEGSANGLRIQNFLMPVLGYNPSPAPPADFHVFAAGSSATLLGANTPPVEATEGEGGR